eukprot:1018857-Amphidinium_carterae.1
MEDDGRQGLPVSRETLWGSWRPREQPQEFNAQFTVKFRSSFVIRTTTLVVRQEAKSPPAKLPVHSLLHTLQRLSLFAEDG